MRALFIAPPWRIPYQGTLAIAMLSPLLRDRGHEVNEIHGSVLFPAEGSDIYTLFQSHARYAFGRALSGCDVEEYIDRIVRSMTQETDMHGLYTGSLEEAVGDEAVMRAKLRETLRKVDVCIERIVARALALGPHDVIGFSTMFDDQVPSSVVIARRLKAAWPGVKVAFGGPACFEEQGDGLVSMYPVELDAACHTEGEEVIVPLFEALASGASLAAIPGIVWRDGDGVRHNPSPPLPRELDRLPLPDYDRFIAQLGSSEWTEHGSHLFFETSRGCWWGEKSLCSFCGLNAEGLAFRSKSPERAYQEIRYLYDRYPSMTSLLGTDNILDMKYLKQVFPRLTDLASDPVRPLKIFYEVKSNMKLEQIEAMSRGGVAGIQPGIESFSDDVLKVMRKGCTALGQVQFIKWAHQSDCHPFYNVLVLNPGEKTASYWEMLELVPFLTHLPPPQSLVTMNLERFSPYHSDPEEYGISNVRPKPFYRTVFGDDVDPRIAYQFDYDHAMFADRAHLDAVRGLMTALRAWQREWKAYTAYWLDEGQRVTIVDARDGHEQRTTLTGRAARLFFYLDQYRSREHIGAAFPEIDAEVLDALLLTWMHHHWICNVGDRYLGVLPRKGPPHAAARPAARERTQVHLQMV